MNSMDAHGLLKSALLRGRYGARKSGSRVAFRCPRHDDSTASAWMGDHAWGCSSCGFTEGLRTLAETLGVELPQESTGTGITLAEYAERKGLSLATLAKAGVEERVGKYGDTLVAMPYRDADGNVIRTKCRTRKGTFWLPDGTGTPLYGQDVLALSRDVVVLVEGESDCHAGWQRGVTVVGLPGASQWRLDYAPLFTDREVVVWQEPDEGGATMVASVAKSLPKARVIREVMYNGQRIKDLCDLHQAVQAAQDDWATVWRGVLANATPIGAEAPAVTFDALIGSTLDTILDEKLAPIDAVPTPLDKWNALCHGGGGGVGLARGWFLTIGGNTGNGKSLVGINLAAEAIRHGEVVTYISLEMGRSELTTRLLSCVSGESVMLLEQGPSFDANAYRRAAGAVDDVRRDTGGYVLMNRAPISRLADVQACFKYHVETFGSRYFVIDYLQLIWTQPSHSDFERVTQVSHTLRELTQQYRTVTVALSQFNRQTSAARQERPVAQGLMGGSAVENDSHQVGLLDHSRFERAGNIADTWLILDKNRHGGVADIPIRWDYRTLRLLPRVVLPGETATPSRSPSRGMRSALTTGSS